MQYAYVLRGKKEEKNPNTPPLPSDSSITAQCTYMYMKYDWWRKYDALIFISNGYHQSEAKILRLSLYSFNRSKIEAKNALNPENAIHYKTKTFLTIIDYQKENSMKIKNQSHKKWLSYWMKDRKKNKSR